MIVRTSGILGRLGDEPLDRGGERLVRVVDEDVAGPDRGEDVGRLVLVGREETGRHDRRPGRQLEVGTIELGDRPQAGEVEHPADLVAVLLVQSDPIEQDLPGRRRHAPLDLEPDGLTEATPTKLLLDRQEQVAGLVLLDRQVGVAGDPEEVGVGDLHAR